MPAPLTHAKIPAAMAPAATTGPATTGPAPLRRAWHAIRAAVAEMNYATRRLADPRSRLAGPRSDPVCQALPGNVADVRVGRHFEFVEPAVAPKYRWRYWRRGPPAAARPS